MSERRHHEKSFVMIFPTLGPTSLLYSRRVNYSFIWANEPEPQLMRLTDRNCILFFTILLKLFFSLRSNILHLLLTFGRVATGKSSRRQRANGSLASFDLCCMSSRVLDARCPGKSWMASFLDTIQNFRAWMYTSL